MANLLKSPKGKAVVKRTKLGRKKGRSPTRPSSLLADDEFSVELRSRVVDLRQDVEDRSEVLQAVGTGAHSRASRRRRSASFTADGRFLVGTTFLFNFSGPNPLPHCVSPARESATSERCAFFLKLSWRGMYMQWQ